MRELALVGLGGAMGSIARVLAGGLVHRWLPLTFPWGTASVNIVGSLLFGVVAGVGAARGGLAPETRAFVLAGLCGGFTTFSAFSYDTLELAMNGYTIRAAANAGGQVVIGVIAIAIGYSLARAAAA
ncbi:MAG: CrcB family protein [Vicinamibacterales bacterium]